jgi:hypothetical protein
MASARPEGESAEGPIDVGPDVASRRRSPRVWIAVAILAVVLAVGGFFGIKAAGGSSTKSSTAAAAGPGGGQRGGGTVGTLQSVDGSTLTISSFNGGNTTVITSSSTKFMKAVTGALSDIKVGDHVAVMGTADGTNAITAQRITDNGTNNNFGARGQGGPRNGTRPGGNAPNANPPAGAPNPGGFANGTVKNISGTIVTVAETNGTTVTVNTGSGTTVSVLRASSLQGLITGQQVRVAGTTNSDGTVTARTVEQGLGGFGAGRGGRQGAPDGTGSTNQ